MNTVPVELLYAALCVSAIAAILAAWVAFQIGWILGSTEPRRYETETEHANRSFLDE